ncbi:MAG TPA: hypothetical protein VJ276_25045, partial [Thermoanaerobaculia bacterium]|nr:hypothetical protein [Thermoanaerobaculia bacterium]
MNLHCIRCDRSYPAMPLTPALSPPGGERVPKAGEGVRYTCDCGGLLEIRRSVTVGRDVFDARRTSRKPIDQSGVWRFREGVIDVDEAQIITHPEGATRLYERDGIFFKHEGENPTGSFKDRG